MPTLTQTATQLNRRAVMCHSASHPTTYVSFSWLSFDKIFCVFYYIWTLSLTKFIMTSKCRPLTGTLPSIKFYMTTYSFCRLSGFKRCYDT